MENTTNKDLDANNFLMVGVGASAGGVQALKQLFSNLPDNTGMAFVVIIHLSEDHESNLHHILQGITSMPVMQVTQPVKVSPDHVYVIPPTKHLEMQDGEIRLVEREHMQGRRIPIDHFFRSLANAYGQRAVCIVLSGSGSDGTLGLKHIKGVNGWAMVQSPEDAEYDSMPLSAIDTGLVDLVLPAAEMGAKLATLPHSTQKFQLNVDDEEKAVPDITDEDSLWELLKFIRMRTGNDFTNYKRPTLLRRIARHLQIHEVNNIPEYLHILKNRHEEASFLVKNLLINVTHFFRDKEAFEAIEKEVIPRLFKDKTSEDHVRIWIAGCASGEEAYSFSILMSEYAATLQDPPKIQIFASDVDEEAVAEAKIGRYTEAITEDVSPSRLSNFFNREKDGYYIKKSQKDLILFATHNLLKDPPFSRLDLISCRNVLIYFNRDTQEKVMRVFHFALKNTGLLFLGSSESADMLTNLFTSIDKKNRFYLRRGIEKAEAQQLPQMPIEGSWQTKVPGMSSVTKQIQATPSFTALHQRLLHPYLPASVLINEEYDILHLSDNAAKYLRISGGEPTINLLKVVRTTLRGDLRAALFSVKQNGKKQESRPIAVQFGGKERLISIIAQPVTEPEAAKGFYLVVFNEIEEHLQEVVKGSAPAMDNEGLQIVIRKLEEEQQNTREQLQKTIEQYETLVEELKASNEEQQAINEELRSASEELETGKEEIHSINEELITINNELKDKVDEVSRANSDLQNLMSSTNIGTIFLDRDLKIQLYTPHLQEYFNLIASDIGRPLEHLKHNFIYDNFSKDAKKVLKTLQPIERELEDKSHRHYILRFFPYRTHDDKIEGVVITFVDVTAWRQSEITRMWLTSIIESSASAIITFSPDGLILNCNKGAETLFGYKAAEFQDQPFTKLMVEGSEQQTSFGKMLSEGNLKQGKSESVFVHKDGHLLHISLTILIVKDNNQVVLGATAIIEDISERIWAEEKLLEKNRELEQFAYVASHDLIEPLNTINSFIMVIESDEYPDIELMSSLKFIKESAVRMTALISGLMHHSRIGKESVPQKMDVARVVKEVLDDMTATINMEHVKVVVDKMPTISAYPMELRLLFQNLISNAIKYRKEEEDPIIHINANKEEYFWHFVVKDNGIGIEERFMEKIFVLFQRLHTNDQIPGTGIGLAHCQKIVELHRGQIWAESTPNVGSEFHFTIHKHLT